MIALLAGDPANGLAVLTLRPNGWYDGPVALLDDPYVVPELRGRGSVQVTVGRTSWAASLMPWADGSAQIVIKKAVRAREGLQLGQELEVTVTARV